MDYCPNLLNELDIEYKLNVIDVSDLNLNILCLNTRSCRNKMDELTQLMLDLKKTIHVIVFTETWLYTDEICNIIDYTAYHSCREDRGGGVSIFVLNILRSQLVLELNYDVNNFLVIEILDYNIKIMGVYNPGRNVLMFLDKFEQIISRIDKLIICGDFNLNLLDSSNELVENYRCRLESLGFLILNSLNPSHATRLSNTICTTIDHFITNYFDKKMCLITKDTERHISDHKTLILSIDFCVRKPEKQVTRYCIRYERFLNNTLGQSINECSSFRNLTQKLTKIIEENKDAFAYKKSYRIRKPYISRELMLQIEHKNQLYKSYKDAPSNTPLKYDLFIKYTYERNRVRNKTKLAKENYYKSEIASHKGNGRKTWELLKELVFQQSKTVLHQNIAVEQDGVILDNDKQVSDCFNNYFVNVGNSCLHQLTSDEFRSFMPPEVQTTFHFVHIREDNVIKIIGNLNSSAASGLDTISVRFVQKCKEYLNVKITELVNEMIDSCVFDDVLKIAKVVPVYKTGNKCEKTNYRPISVLPVLSKICEKVLTQQLSDYFFRNNLIHENQFGFVPKSNTESATLELVNFVVKGLDDGQYVACIFIDLKKAFDCIPHEILLGKLKYYGLSESSVELVTSYLSNRKQICCVNGVLSDARNIYNGVPQGSIIGPLLFNIFINDLLKLPLRGFLQCYADDAVSKYRAQSLPQIQEMMQNDLEIMQQWFSANKMSINTKKTNFMLFTTTHSSPSITLTINNEPLKQVQETNYLGIVIDSRLKWNSHINKVRKKILPYVFAIKRVRKCLGMQSCWQIYNSYILPHLTYLLCIWGSAASTQLNVLRVLQNKAVKSIRGLPPLYPTNALYCHKYLSLGDLYRFSLMYTIYKIKYGIIKSNIEITPATNIHSHGTRNRHRFYTTRPRTELASRHILYTGIVNFNLLPNNIKHETIVMNFKRKLKIFIFEN